MAIPWLALSLLPSAPPLLRGASNAAAVGFDALKKNGLGGFVNAYTSGDILDSYYAGATAANGLLAPQEGAQQVVSGQTKEWDRVHGWQLPNVTGTSTRQSPIKYTSKGAPIDPNTNQVRTGNISVPPPAPVLPPPDTLASVPPAKPEDAEVIDTERAKAAAVAAKKYEQEQAKILDAHKNYKTMREFGGEPVVTQGYMEQDAMRIWANANPELAKKLIEKNQLNGATIFNQQEPAPMTTSPFIASITSAPVAQPGIDWSKQVNSGGMSIDQSRNLAALFKEGSSLLEDKVQMPNVTYAGGKFVYS